MNAITKSDNEVQAILDLAYEASKARYLAKVEAEAQAKTARLARIANTPVTACACTLTTSENTWAVCECN